MVCWVADLLVGEPELDLHRGVGIGNGVEWHDTGGVTSPAGQIE